MSAGNAVVRGIKCVASLFTPSFYKNSYLKIIENNRADIRNGSIRPFFKAIGLVWITGYTMNYVMMKSKLEIIFWCNEI